MIYMTAGTLEEAGAIGRELISRRLAACVNIIDRINSFYWWEGKVRDDREVVIIAKTKESLVPELIREVMAMHSYECPCVVALPISAGFPPFLKWIEDETK
jgi:periplasmic divalent cation tolerance protein